MNYIHLSGINNDSNAVGLDVKSKFINFFNE